MRSAIEIERRILLARLWTEASGVPDTDRSPITQDLFDMCIDVSAPDFSPHEMAAGMKDLAWAINKFGELLATEEGQDE